MEEGRSDACEVQKSLQKKPLGEALDFSTSYPTLSYGGLDRVRFQGSETYISLSASFLAPPASGTHHMVRPG